MGERRVFRYNDDDVGVVDDLKINGSFEETSAVRILKINKNSDE